MCVGCPWARGGLYRLAKPHVDAGAATRAIEVHFGALAVSFLTQPGREMGDARSAGHAADLCVRWRISALCRHGQAEAGAAEKARLESKSAAPGQ